MEKGERDRRKGELTCAHCALHVIHQLPTLFQIFSVVKPVLPPGDLRHITA